MIKSNRHSQIISVLAESDELSIHEIARRLGTVSSVTVRRDVAELAQQGALRRTHGGASRVDIAVVGKAEIAETTLSDEIGDVDAIILPPIEGRGADTLRRMAIRRRIPFLAESAPQEGGVYIGPDNFGVARELGNRAGRALSGKIDTARILLVSLDRLANTRSRCDGFVKGFNEVFNGPVETCRVDGRGRFRIALGVAMDAFTVHPDINVVFGVNDHSVLAALEAADKQGVDNVYGFGVGGEGDALFDALKANRKMCACAALFPEIVGVLSIDYLALALAGEPMPMRIDTPHVILTTDNLSRYYQSEADGWSLCAQAQTDLLGARRAPTPADQPLSIGFVPHYPAHDWYRNMIRAMRHRAGVLGYELRLAPPQAGIAREIHEVRQVIARFAASKVSPGETVALNTGETSLLLAEELAQIRDITVVTNSLDIMDRLTGKPGVKLILTSGEYHARHRCLVGPSLGALFETLKVDKAFLSVDGVTARFGISSTDERLALASRRFIAASREPIVLADHSIIGVDANNRIAALGAIGEIVTDSGSLPADRLALTASGAAVTIADEVPENYDGTDLPEARNAPWPAVQ